MKRKILGFTAMALLLAGCAGGTPRLGEADTPPPPGLEVVRNAPLPPQVREGMANGARPYHIGPFDRLIIDVFGVEDMRLREIQVDASGRVAFPLAGSIDANGLTPGELADAIATRLRQRYVRDPQVTVNLRETLSQTVGIDGQVTMPGIYPVVGRTTLMRAIATARGLSEFARLEDVIIFRTVNGQRMAGVYNLGAIRNGAYEDPEIFANDFIVVGDSQSRRIFRDLLQSAPLLSTPLLLIFGNN